MSAPVRRVLHSVPLRRATGGHSRPLGTASTCTYSPLFSRGLSGVKPADAADASGVMITIIQLGQVVGISLPGTLFLSRVSYPAPPVDSGHALAIMGIVVGVAAVVGAGFAHRTRKAGLDD